MTADRMPPGNSCQPSVAADAEFVDGAAEHVLEIGGMGIMAGYTPPSENDAVDEGHRILLAHQVLLVAMT
jgi:hypothetical protein